MTNIRSLYTGNVIDDATANRNAAEQPKFTSTNKAAALTELIASIPEEERKTATADKNALLEATFVHRCLLPLDRILIIHTGKNSAVTAP